jgi:hypothetical protein
MDPCSVDDIVVPDYSVGVVETMELLEINAHCQNVAQSVLPSTHPASYMHMRLFPSSTPEFCNFCLHVPLTYKSYRKYSLVMSCTSTS